MTFEIKPYPEFSWSSSRNELFNECKRKYYYNYYGSHNGWLFDAPEEAKEAYRLKQISNAYLVFGQALHEIAKKSVLEKSIPDKTAAINEIRDKLNSAFRDSRDKASWESAPKKKTMLHDMYYEGGLKTETINEIKNRMVKCIDNLINSTTLREIINDPSIEIVESDDGMNHIVLDGKKIYAILDVLYVKDNDNWVVVDWKTGYDAESIKEQLLMYALYVYTEYGIPVENIELKVEYLLTGECKSTKVTEEELFKMIEKLKESQKQMESYLEDANLNKPLPAENFPQTLEKFRCKNCNFRKLCNR